MKASREYIAPGVRLASSLSSGPDASSGTMEEKLTELHKYHERSLNGIHEIAKQLPVCSPTCV